MLNWNSAALKSYAALAAIRVIANSYIQNLEDSNPMQLDAESSYV